jgi:hypothetical protein
MSSADADRHANIHEELTLARLAAAHGDLGDYGNLIRLLAVAASLDVSDQERDALGAETLARLSELANAGVDLAAQYLPAFAELMSAEPVSDAASA